MATDKPLSTEMQRQKLIDIVNGMVALSFMDARKDNEINLSTLKANFTSKYASLDELRSCLFRNGEKNKIVFTVVHDDENHDLSSNQNDKDNPTKHCLKLVATSVEKDTFGIQVVVSTLVYKSTEMPKLVSANMQAAQGKNYDNFAPLIAHSFQERRLWTSVLGINVDEVDLNNNKPPVPIATQQPVTTAAIATALTPPSQKPLTHAFGIPDDATTEMLKAEIKVIKDAKSDYLTFIGKLVLDYDNLLSFTEVSNTFKQIMMTHHKDTAFKESMNLLTREYTTFMDFTENPTKNEKYRIKEALDAIKASKLNDNFPSE